MNAPFVGFKAIKDEALSKALVVIDYPHAELHEGEHFYFTDQLQLASAATREFLFEIPLNTFPHILFAISSSQDTTLQLYEDTAKTTGTPITIFNNNRNSLNTSPITLSHTPVGAASGTLIFSARIGSSTGTFRAGENRGDIEIIFKTNSKYRFLITSNASGNNVSTIFEWYE